MNVPTRKEILLLREDTPNVKNTRRLLSALKEQKDEFLQKIYAYMKTSLCTSDSSMPFIILVERDVPYNFKIINKWLSDTFRHIAHQGFHVGYFSPFTISQRHEDYDIAYLYHNIKDQDEYNQKVHYYQLIISCEPIPYSSRITTFVKPTNV